MNNMKLVAEFKYSNPAMAFVPQASKTVIEHCFLNLYNEACNRINPCYEKWNAEFDIRNHTEEEYNNYISRKQQPVIDQINKEMASNLPVKLCPMDQANIGGMIVNDAGKVLTTFYFTLKPIK